jgi:hypothetical protein
MWLASAIFGLCVAPTLISYRPYSYSWDDAEYLQRSITVSQGLWSGNLHAIGSGMVSIRPPAMTLLALPWGPVASWDAAGDCFVSLAGLTALFVALCLYILLRIGVKPLFLAIASLCLLASIGPFGAAPSRPMSEFSTHEAATAFLADGLLAWITLAAVLLIPYEARITTIRAKESVVHGILWGLILSSGAMTKVSCFYFIGLIVPILLAIRFRRNGVQGAFGALVGMVVSSAPAAFYWFRWGRVAWENAKDASFGASAGFFYMPLSQFLRNLVREQPGLAPALLLAAAALAYVAIGAIKKRILLRPSDFLALLITLGFGIVALASLNREIRYALPVIVATPFLIAVLISGAGNATPYRPAALVAVLVFCGLTAAAIPMHHRADRRCLSTCDSVLAAVAKCDARRVLLATASPTLNVILMRLAIAVSPSRPSVDTDTLVFNAISGVPIADDFRSILESDQVIFQDREAVYPPQMNQRAPEYEQYIRQQRRFDPVRVASDVNVYQLNCRQ